jgi:WS/DGAT/MGAT family acyltransferase
MQQLAPRDALFLSMETPTTPTHIGGLVFLAPEDGSDFDHDRFVAFVRERLRPIERFSWQLQEVPFGLDRPYWVKREDFDPADHVHSIRIPAPYSPESLSQLAGRIFERPMDRSRPLWDMVLIEGLPNGRYALLWRMHHCMMDGVSGASLSEQLFDVSPEGTRSTGPGFRETARADRRPTSSEIATRALGHALGLPLRQAHYARQIAGALMPERGDQARTSALAEPEHSESGLVPRALFNGVTSSHRQIAWSSVPLEDVKRVKNTLGTTVNDVVLAITGGAVRDYHTARKALPEQSFAASVPVSLRKAEDTEIGNRIREQPMYWGTDLEDPVERLIAIHERAQRAKQTLREGRAFDLYGLLSEAFLPGALQLFALGTAAAGDRTPLPSNAVVSNVPMAPIPLYCAGARIEQVVPLSVLAPSQGLNITVLSYAGQLHFGIVSDPALLESGWELAESIPKQLLTLQAGVERELRRDPAKRPEIQTAATR